MMETRDPLEWHFKQLDHAMGLSFKANFNFALVGHLLKGGLRTKHEMNEKKCKAFFWTELKEHFSCSVVHDFTILGFRHPAQTTTSRTIRVLNQLLSITVKPTNR